jgi:hypothetical protein
MAWSTIFYLLAIHKSLVSKTKKQYDTIKNLIGLKVLWYQGRVPGKGCKGKKISGKNISNICHNICSAAQ